MLAGAEVQVRALRSSIEMLVPRVHGLSDPVMRPHLALLKALAGRTGHHVAQATLQVLGGIGFTEEHEHHHYEKRVLTLDALCGSREELARENRAGGKARSFPPRCRSVKLGGRGSSDAGP